MTPATPAIITGGIQVASSLIGAKAARDQGLREDAIAKYDAQVQLNQGIESARRITEEAKILRRRTRRSISSLKAKGADLFIIEESAANAELAINSRLRDAQIEEQRGRNQAQITRQRGRSAKRASRINVATSLLSGANSVARRSLDLGNVS